ncbi:nucleopolyhedrovirus P10 family protein [Streptomyces sp. NPDC006285]|uniref:nucleopolyhedrovirus P10 family protein n=1 Tax=Streptomyces sp. NPDC006285 TaxID=3364742 RepID=UPI0036ACFE28
MTADRWTQAVRQQLGLGRLLPLGGSGDGAWITEAAAVRVLRRAVRQVPYVRLGAVRLSLVDPDGASEPVVPAPPSALRPGPLRITAEFAATPTEPLPATASRVRDALASAAAHRLGLDVTEVDLRVTGLLEEGPPPPEPDPAEADAVPSAEPHTSPDTADESRVSAAALSVPGVTALSRPPRVEERHTDAALPHRHVRVEIEVAETAGRTLDVTRAVRATVTKSLPDHPTTAVLVTAITPLP